MKLIIPKGDLPYTWIKGYEGTYKINAERKILKQTTIIIDVKRKKHKVPSKYLKPFIIEGKEYVTLMNYDTQIETTYLLDELMKIFNT